MSDDEPAEVPADVRSVLGQLLAESRAALTDGDTATARGAMDTVERVARNKLPESPLRERLLHGCQRVRALIGDRDGDDGGDEHDDVQAADEYLAAMERRLPPE